MKITHVFKETSKQAGYMRCDFKHNNISTIYSAHNNPSHAKIQAYNNIIMDYKTNNGLHAIQVGRKFLSLQYNDDIRVAATSCHFFTTIASFTDTQTGDVYLIKETHANTIKTPLLYTR